MSSNLNALLPNLKEPKSDGKGGYMAFCPCHADGQKQGRRSLRITERDGQILIHCFAGCEYRDIAQALGLSGSQAWGQEEPEKTYDYLDEGGQLLFQVVRSAGKRFWQRRPDGNGGWIKNVKGIRPVPYRLPNVLEAVRGGRPVYIVEGEKDCDRLSALGVTATTNPGGAGKWRSGYSRYFKGARVIVIPDNDPPGQKHAMAVARSLYDVAEDIKILHLPNLPPKGDISDWLANGGSLKVLEQLVAEVPAFRLIQEVVTEDKEESGKPSQADIIVGLVENQNIELFHDHFAEPYIRTKINGHWEVHRAGSSFFRRWIAILFYESQGKVPNSEAISNAIRVIEAKACIEGPEYKLHNRVARVDDAFYYDLADPQWRVVKITADGWEILEQSPILFRRLDHQLPQVLPERGGGIKDVHKFVNIRDEDDRLLFEAILVVSLIPDIPHPIPIFHGEQGSAKSYALKILRRLIDPSKAETLSFPKKTPELVQKLDHNWAAYFDNVTDLPDWIVDILCRAVTGEGFAKRKLYTDDEDVIYSFRRCIGLNGVNIASTRPDLLDRSFLFQFERIPKDQRRPEEELDLEFQRCRGWILGGIFDVLAEAMKRRNGIVLSDYPRLADFAVWGCASAEALGYTQKQFERAYWANIQRQNREAIDAHPVGTALLHFLEDKTEWEGTPTELLSELEKAAAELKLNMRAKKWPKAPHILTRRINEVRTNLREEGWEITDLRGTTRMLIFSKSPRGAESSVSSVNSVEDQENQDIIIDATVGDSDADEKIASARKPLRTTYSDATDAIDATLPLFKDDEETAEWVE